MQNIDWLTEQVRNRLMHFVPSLSLIEIEGVRKTSLVALDAIDFLISESGTILFGDMSKRLSVQDTIKVLRSQLEAEEALLERLANEALAAHREGQTQPLDPDAL